MALGTFETQTDSDFLPHGLPEHLTQVMSLWQNIWMIGDVRINKDWKFQNLRTWEVSDVVYDNLCFMLPYASPYAWKASEEPRKKLEDELKPLVEWNHSPQVLAGVIEHKIHKLTWEQDQ